MILDSTFLVDLEREIRKGADGAASAFLRDHADRELAVTFTVAGELAAGETLGSDYAKWQEYLEPFRFLGYEDRIGWRYGAVYRELKAKGTLIGANDLWIAATALVHGVPLVTRNGDEFRRVTGLDVREY